jgi:DNA-binding transcriptional MocR family regulator
MSVTAANFVLTSGASGGLKNLCDVYIRPGDVVVTEQPTFSGSLGTLAGSAADVIGVSIDDDGIDPVALDETLGRLKSEGKTVRLLCTVPNFNNPELQQSNRRPPSRLRPDARRSRKYVRPPGF